MTDATDDFLDSPSDGAELDALDDRRESYGPASSGLRGVVAGPGVLAGQARWRLGEFESKIWTLLLAVVGIEDVLARLFLLPFPRSRSAEK